MDDESQFQDLQDLADELHGKKRNNDEKVTNKDKDKDKAKDKDKDKKDRGNCFGN